MSKYGQCGLCKANFGPNNGFITLSCLHSYCRVCLKAHIKQEGKICPDCLTPIIEDLDSIKSDNNSAFYYVKQLGQFQESNSQGIKYYKEKCELCEADHDACGFCSNCSQYLCESCQKTHKKAKISASHEIIPMEEIMERQERRHICIIHPPLLNNNYCKSCETVCCSLCVKSNHSGNLHSVIPNISLEHDLVQTATKELVTALDKLKSHGASVKEGLKKFQGTLEELEENSTAAENKIHDLFRVLKEAIEKRESELIGQIQTIKEEKENNLRTQESELSSFFASLQFSYKLTDHLLKNGNEGEILVSKRFLTGKITNLLNKPCGLEPLEDTTFEVVEGNTKNNSTMVQQIQQIGGVKVKNISPDYSYIDNARSFGNILVNQLLAFDVVAMDSTGKLLPKGGEKFTLEIKGPSTVTGTLVDQRNGRYSASFKLNQPGNHQIMVKLKGKDIKGSPLTVMCLKTRDVREIGPEIKLSFGTSGSGNDQFNSPNGIAINSKGYFVIADAGNNRIAIYDGNFKFILNFGVKGMKEGQFNTPAGVAVDLNDDIIVTDANHRVQRFDDRGTFVKCFGGEGKNDGQLFSPTAVLISKFGNHVVVDSGNHRVQIFDANGKFLFKFGPLGKLLGNLNTPYGIAINSQGHFIVSDLGNNRLVVYDSKGVFIKTMGEKQLSKPHHVMVDGNDNIFVCDYNNNRIQVFNPEGTLFHTFGNNSNPNLGLSCPVGVTTDSAARIAVTQAGLGRSRVSLF